MWWTFDDSRGATVSDYADNFSARGVWAKAACKKHIKKITDDPDSLILQTGGFEGNPESFITCDVAGWDSVIQTGAFTFCVWIQPQSLPPATGHSAAIADARVASPMPGAPPEGFAVLVNADGVTAVCGFVTNTHSGAFDLGRFTHVAVTFPDPATGGLSTIHIDGTPVATAALPPWIVPTLPTLYAGKNVPGTDGAPFHGEMDDLMFFSRALTADEVAALAAAGPGGIGPQPPDYFDTEWLRGGVDDELAGGNTETADPGPLLGALPDCCNAPDEEDPSKFFALRQRTPNRGLIGSQGSERYVAAAELKIGGRPFSGGPGGAPHIKIQIYPPNWQPGVPFTEVEVPLDLIWSPRSNVTFIGTLNLGDLPDGTNLLPALRVAEFIDVSVRGAAVDFVEIALHNQKAPPRDFGLVQVPLDDTELVSTAGGLTVGGGPVSGAPSHKASFWNCTVTTRPNKPPKALHRTVVDLPTSPAGSGLATFGSTTRTDVKGPGAGPHVKLRSTVNLHTQFTGLRGQLILEADLDGDDDFEPLADRIIEVFNAGALVYSGPMSSATFFTAGPRQTVALSSGANTVSVLLPPTAITLEELPPGSPPVENKTATLIRCRKAGKEQQEYLVAFQHAIVRGSAPFLVHDEAVGADVDHAHPLPDLFLVGRAPKIPPPRGVVGGCGGGNLCPSYLEEGRAINTSVPRRVPALAGDGGFHHVMQGENPFYEPARMSGLEVHCEVPNRRDDFTEMATWTSRGKIDAVDAPLTKKIESNLRAVPAPGVEYADGSVLLASVDFSEVGGDGYRLRGLDSLGNVVFAMNSPMLPEVRFDNFPARHAINKNGAGTSGRVVASWHWGDPNTVCFVRVAGAAYAVQTLEISPLTQSVEMRAIHSIDHDCDGIQMLGVVEARGMLLPAVQKRLEITRAPLPGAWNVPRAILHYLRSEGRLQDAAQLNGPWRETPGAETTDDFFYASDELMHFFRVADPSVPETPRHNNGGARLHAPAPNRLRGRLGVEGHRPRRDRRFRKRNSGTG